MDPDQVGALARICAASHPRYEGFVLIQGLCGLRPGEAIELRRRDFALDPPAPTLTVRGSHSKVGSQ